MTQNGEGEILPLFGEDPPTLLCSSHRQQLAFARARKPSKLSSPEKIGGFLGVTSLIIGHVFHHGFGKASIIDTDKRSRERVG
jgi:hypothetical protein